MTRAVDKYIFSGSPFIPGPMEEILQNIMQKKSPFEPGEFTIAQEIRAVTMYHAPFLLGQMRDLNQNFGTVPQDLSMYVFGFDAPLEMITLGYMAIFTNDTQALNTIAPADNPMVEEFRQNLKRDLGLYKSALKKEPSGRLIFLQEEDHPFSSNIYYQVGVRAAKITFINYAKLLGADFS